MDYSQWIPPEVLGLKHIICTPHKNRHALPLQDFTSSKIPLAPPILISYVASDRQGILHLHLPNKTTTVQIDHPFIHHRTNTYKTIIIPPSKTIILKPIKTIPLKPLLKTNVPVPNTDAAKDSTSLMKAFPRSFNMPRHHTIRTDPSIKPLEHAHIRSSQRSEPR